MVYQSWLKPLVLFQRHVLHKCHYWGTIGSRGYRVLSNSTVDFGWCVAFESINNFQFRINPNYKILLFVTPYNFSPFNFGNCNCYIFQIPKTFTLPDYYWWGSNTWNESVVHGSMPKQWNLTKSINPQSYSPRTWACCQIGWANPELKYVTQFWSSYNIFVNRFRFTFLSLAINMLSK